MPLEQEVKVAEVEIIAQAAKDEPVAIYCYARKKKNADGTLSEADMNTFGKKVELQKAGEHNLILLRAGQVVRLKRNVAEWHVAKHRSAIDHSLELRVITLDELAEFQKTGKLKALEPSKREVVIQQLIAAGVIANKDEAADIELSVLEKALADKREEAAALTADAHNAAQSPDQL